MTASSEKSRSATLTFPTDAPQLDLSNILKHGSDMTSQFLGDENKSKKKAKKSCEEAWKSFPPVTEAFMYPNVNPFQPMSVNS